jgi:hypothetical protein
MLLIMAADCFGQGDAAALVTFMASIVSCGVAYALVDRFAKAAHGHRTTGACEVSTQEREDGPDA